MPTTIQVSEKTKRMLITLRGQLKQSSYDKALQEILPPILDTPSSLAGKFPDLGSWSRKDRMKFRGE